MLVGLLHLARESGCGRSVSHGLYPRRPSEWTAQANCRTPQTRRGDPIVLREIAQLSLSAAQKRRLRISRREANVYHLRAPPACLPRLSLEQRTPGVLSGGSGLTLAKGVTCVVEIRVPEEVPMAWRNCSTCKSEIGWNSPYYVCSVSTCQGRVTNYVFCSVNCWDAHVPVERHRPESSGAIERRSPREGEEPAAPARRIVPTKSPGASGSGAVETEVLVVVSKVRKYIADRSGMNTSASVYDALTERIQRLCDQAIEVAKSQSRKTVMDRDIP